MPSKNSMQNDEVLLYQTDDGKTRIDVRLQGETVWLTQMQMTELFQTTKQNVSLHLKNVFDEGELIKDSVVKESLTTASDGKKYNTAYYNLDVVISVGYRVKSIRGTQFRIWATSKLREYSIKGYVLNDARLQEHTEAKLKELEHAHKIIQQALETHRLDGYEKDLLHI